MLRRFFAALIALSALYVIDFTPAPAAAGRPPDDVTKAAPGKRPKGGSTTTTSTPTTTAPPPTTTTGATVQGGRLLLNGQPWVFGGVNAPQATTFYDVNGGCGAALDLPRLFASLAPNSVVRVSFHQDAAINSRTGLRDWRGIDHVIKTAEASTNPIHLIVGITNQAGICDGGHWRGHDFYAGGYMNVPPPTIAGLPQVSYWDWIHELVPRYAGSNAIAMWEPVGEPEASVCEAGYAGGECYSHKWCPADATAVLRGFYDKIGAEFHRMDPSTLVASGTLGGDQCGWAGDGSLQIQASPGIDVVTFHDYGYDDMPVSPWLARRIDEARILGKPIISEETGITSGSECTSIARRAEQLAAKKREGEALGVAGFLPWLYSQSTEPVMCDYQLRPDDPAFIALT